MLFLCLLNYFLASLVGRITHRISRILNLNVINPHPEISHGEEDSLGKTVTNESVTLNETPESTSHDLAVEEILNRGSTAIIAKVKPGVVLKSPRFVLEHCELAETSTFITDIKHSFSVEKQIFGILGEHPRIIRFLGVSENPQGLLLAEASHGNLQAYIDQHNDTINLPIRLKWRSQASEAIKFIHQHDVIHSDLRPENFLLHTNHTDAPDLLLCDFGGSTCGAVDGGHLPDSGFFNPREPWLSTPATDIFSLGSVFYTIMTGHWPYSLLGPFSSAAEKQAYEEMVDAKFAACIYPPTDDHVGGNVILGCWTGEYKETGALIRAQNLSFKEYQACNRKWWLEINYA